MGGGESGMDKVSIVLHAHNQARMLPEAVESVFSQTHHDWELIVIDDASNEDIGNELVELQRTGHPMRIVRNAREEGLAASLNTGFALAAGEFLTWTTEENHFRPHAFEVMVKMMTGHDFVYADCAMIDDMGKVMSHTKAVRPENILLETSIDPCFLYRRSVYERIGNYDAKWGDLAPLDYWIRVVKAGFRMKAVPDEVFEKRLHFEDLQHDHDPTWIRQTEALLRIHCCSLPEPHKTACRLQLAKLAWQRGSKSEARSLAMKSMGKGLRMFRGDWVDSFWGPGTAERWRMN
ncbi:MAG: glycosyltransferase family 2 protein [Armatimonadetes bacterium]|nr:glycosyltransferase family 2 protein [Armatimonadota bacterium]